MPENPNYKKDEYTAHLPKWTLIHDCIEGEFSIKDKAQSYLPMPNEADQSAANKARYQAYLTRAVFYGVTGRTLAGMVGQVFATDAEVKLAPLLNSLEENVDGSGVTLNQQAAETLGNTLSVGRSGLLVDYPTTESVTTAEQLTNGERKPNILFYDTTRIINWRSEMVGSHLKQTLVVLTESYVTEEDLFNPMYAAQLRVLMLEDGIYKVRIYRAEGDNGDFRLHEEIVPVDSSGAPLDTIPFVFVGSVNNNDTVDNPPLLDISVLNLAHYRNSADYEESSYMVGQPTPFFTGLTEVWMSEVLKDGITLGSRTAVPLPANASAGLLQAAPNSMPKEAMDHKERQMVALGAKLVEQKTVQRTLGEAAIEEASESSVLARAAKNVNAAYAKCFEYASLFVGNTQESVYILNTDFNLSKLTPQELTALLQSWQGGGISWAEYREKLRQAGVATLDDEEADELIKESLGNELDDTNPDA